MKKKLDKDVLNESCFIMNIPKTLSTTDGSHLSNNIPEDSKISLQNTLTPPQSITSSPNSKIKYEQENSVDPAENGDVAEEKVSPPPSSLGPGAEIKGKICHPIPSGSSIQLDESESLEELYRSASGNISSGGRLTFFKEGKLLLELSHRSEQGSWVQVKSKTYWPPPSSTASTTTIQHPLRHDTPVTHSDDCSSINSSPWTSERARKQLVPSPCSKLWFTTDHLFFLKQSPHIRDIRRRVRLRRNPFCVIVEMLNSSASSDKNSIGGEFKLPPLVKNMKYIDRKSRLERTVSRLGRRCALKLDDNVSIRSLFERVTAQIFVGENTAASSGAGPTFVTPRKRFLRTLETDFDSHSRKKAYSGSNPVLSGSGVCSLVLNHSAKHHCDSKLSSFPSSSSSPSSTSPPSSSPSPSLYAVSKSANSSSSQNASAYSIDSLLSNESSSSSENVIRKSDSFLRTLKPDKLLRSSSQGNHAGNLPIRDKNTADISTLFPSVKKLEKERDRGVGSSHYPKEVTVANNRTDDSKKSTLPDRYDLSNVDLASAARFGSPNPFYLNPYFDPRYMVFSPSPNTPPSSLLSGAVSQSGNDMASAVAVAAAAAAGYPITPLHLSALTASLASGVYSPPTSLTSHMIRSPNSNRSSPLSVLHSPSPKLSHAPPAIPFSSHLGMAGSPRDMWTPAIPNSLQKYPSTSPVSPPPQDVPLNLSKPKRKF